MTLDFYTLNNLRNHHPAWRLLSSPHAPLVASFLQHVFIAKNVRVMEEGDLVEALENELYVHRLQLGEAAFPQRAIDYLNDWASPVKGWLRKFYRHGSDEPQFDLTPATEKAIAWLGTLTERSFVGTESRLLTLFELLRQMSAGSEADPVKRIAELNKRRDEIEAEIKRVLSGDLPLLDDTALKDRFQQFMQLARELLSDFREVEHNFRQLDRRVRERIAQWDGSKGALLDDIMTDADAIAESDQGKSFRAFWDFLMSSKRQEELTELLSRVLALPPIVESKPDARTRRVHYDWLEAGEHTQRTVAQLSQQLRRFLDDQAWLENRRIMEILRSIEAHALALRDDPSCVAAGGDVMRIEEPKSGIALPMERPLFTPPLKPLIADIELLSGEGDADTSLLYAHSVVNTTLLTSHIRHALQDHTQITLRELTELHPLQHGLSELVAYLQLGSEVFTTAVEEETPEVIVWEAKSGNGDTIQRAARLPRVIFVR